MRKVLAAILLVIIAFTGSGRIAIASIVQNKVHVSLRAESAKLPSEQALTMEENERATRMEMAPTLQSVEPIATKAVAAYPDGQAAPTNTQTQTPPAHHNHHVRNLVILGVTLASALQFSQLRPSRSAAR